MILKKKIIPTNLPLGVGNMILKIKLVAKYLGELIVSRISFFEHMWQTVARLLKVSWHLVH